MLNLFGLQILKPKEAAMLLTIDRSAPFDPVKFLGTPGFTVKSQNQRSASIDVLDTSKLRLEYGMYGLDPGRPWYRSARVEWLEAKGLLVPDGHVIEALKKHPECLSEQWAADCLTLHLDGIGLESSWDGREFEIYTIYNRVRKFWEFPYLGPWAGRNPSLVIEQ